MSWGAPFLFWFLALLPVAALLRFLWGRHLRRQQLGIGATSKRHLDSRRPGLIALRQILLWSGLALAMIAGAQPRWGVVEDVHKARGANLAILLDCSRSMLAEDHFPTRLEAARQKVIELLHAAPEHRMALIPFAAKPLRRSPLTGDAIALEQMLDGCTPELFPVQGTAIGKAVQDAVDFLQQHGDRGRAIVLFTDGSDPDEESVAAAAEAAELADIPVYGLFFGDPDSQATLMIDGVEQKMPADRSTLNTLADASTAINVNAVLDHQDVAAIQEHIDQRVPLVPWQEEQRRISSEQYQLLLWPALLLIAAGAFLPTGRRRQMWERGHG